MLNQTEPGTSKRAFMVGSVVHHQNQSLLRIVQRQELFQKGEKSVGIGMVVDLVADGLSMPVERAKNMGAVMRVGGDRNLLLGSAFHPTLAQGRIPIHGSFIHKEELESMVVAPFFNSSSSSSACSLAFAFCKWVRSCLGRRYTYPKSSSKTLSHCT